MQKQKKQFIIILVLLLALAACYAGLTIYNSKQEEKEAAEEEAAQIKVTDLTSDEINTLSFTSGETMLSFTKQDEEWICDQDQTADIDEDQISSLLSSVISITAEDEVTDYDSLEDYGLSEPSLTVTLTTAEDSYTLQFGSTNTVLSADYMMLSGNDALYLVSTSIQSSFDVTLEDLVAEEEETETEMPAEAE